MEIFILQYALAVLICLWAIKPFKKITLGKRFKIPLFNFLGMLSLLFIGSYAIAHEISLKMNIAFLGDAFFLWINMLLFILVPSGFVFLKTQFYNRGFQNRDFVHLLPSLLYVGCFIYPYFLYHTEFLSPDSRVGFFFRVYSYCIVSIYILLVMRILFYKYLPFPVFSKEPQPETALLKEKTDVSQPADKREVFVGSVYLVPEQVSKMDETLRNYFLTQQPFLKRGYNLKQLSDETSIPLHQLSAFINQYYHRNFNDFINEYRVQYCQAKIRNEEWRSKTLEAIAEESGFNNRNTFTSAFKKVTGYNPSDFLRMVKQKQIA